MSGDVIVDPALQQRLRFERTTDDQGREVLRIDVWVDPGGGVPAHIHPSVEERFHVVSGRASFLSGRRWSEASAGETVVVPPGVRHAYRNRADAEAHVVCEARPPSSLQQFLEETAALGRAGKISRRLRLPTSPGAMLEGIALAERHRDMVRLLFPLPPWPVQRLLFPPLARLAERRASRA